MGMVYSFHSMVFSTNKQHCMYPFLKQVQGPHRTSLSYYPNLIDHCLSLKSLTFAKTIHAQLIKVGFDSHIFLGNRCLGLYSQYGTVNDALKVFDGISDKNCIPLPLAFYSFFSTLFFFFFYIFFITWAPGWPTQWDGSGFLEGGLG